MITNIIEISILTNFLQIIKSNQKNKFNTDTLYIL